MTDNTLHILIILNVYISKHKWSLKIIPQFTKKIFFLIAPCNFPFNSSKTCAQCNYNVNYHCNDN